MAYQNVGTPRFYINTVEWAAQGHVGIGTPGYGTDAHELIDTLHTLPVEPILVGSGIGISNVDFLNIESQQGFVAMLGHTIGTQAYNFTILGHANSIPDQTNVINADCTTWGSLPILDGFSIRTFTHIGNTTSMEVAIHNENYFMSADRRDAMVGSIVIGNYYDMPQNPNLSLSLSYEYDGVKTITTKGGSDLSYRKYTNPMWRNLGAWELDVGDPISTQFMRKSGRRSWDLKFSFMDDGDLWGPNQSLGQSVWGPIPTEQGTDSGDIASDNTFNTDVLSDDNFFSQVWHKTNSGVLPFIFQPDNTDNRPQSFAICKFKNNSLKATQSAFNVYDISLSIEEVW